MPPVPVQYSTHITLGILLPKLYLAVYIEFKRYIIACQINDIFHCLVKYKYLVGMIFV